MQLVFVYGPVAAGKLTVARELARLADLPLFHNHLIVDAVAAVFPFGSPSFVRLREAMWLEVIDEAAAEGRSLIFTFAPEPTVAADFPERVRALVASRGGEVLFVRLEIAADEQEQRLVQPSRGEFGKLQSVDLLRSLSADFARSMEAMPEAAVTIDTGAVAPREAAETILARMSA